MTNEKAIEYLKWIRPVRPYSLDKIKVQEAIDLAIKALETGEIYITGEDYNLYMEGYKAGKNDFEPKQGEWILPNFYGDGVSYECGNCHIPHEGYIGKDGKPHGYDYCPNCGAKMQEGSAENG